MILSEEIDRIKTMMGLNEAREGLLRYLREKLPKVPEYVLKDFFYKIKDYEKDKIDKFLKLWSDVNWVLHKDFTITMDIFVDRDKEILQKRISGEIKDYVPNDELRHQIQKQKLETSGLSEPILLTKFPEVDKYNMDEGWHRVIQSFIKNPEGFNYPNVYIGYWPFTKEEYKNKLETLFPEWKEINEPLSNTH